MISPRSFLVSRQHARHLSSSPPVSPSTSPPTQAGKRKDERQTNSITHTSTGTMAAGKRKEPERKVSPTPSLPKTTTSLARPTTPTSPVQIPIKSKSRETAHPPKNHRHHGDRRHQPGPLRPRDVHSPDAIPPSVAALLAITNIPPPSKGSRSLRQQRSPRDNKRLTVESIIERSHESEKELSLTLDKSPLDVLLSAPEELECDDVSPSDSNIGSALSTRTVSVESMPSLADSFTTETLSSIESPYAPSRRRKSTPTRRSLEPVSSPPGQREEHPLSAPPLTPRIEVEELDFRVFQGSPDPNERRAEMRVPVRPLKSAFKSNLTASLRALRQAARSFSSMNLPSIPPDDFLTRSILTIDPQVPYTDERRPPPLEEEPTAALRRYLNPTTNTRIEQPRSTSSSPSSPPAFSAFTASIQMQTYKVHRSRSAPPTSGRIPHPASNTVQGMSPLSQTRDLPMEFPLPGPRQREMRENSDFIRIAVMEMAMRKRGKLDDQRPGRARWALPPRRISSKPYEIRSDGVPARWVAVTY